MNRSLHIEYPSTLPDALHQTPTEFEQDARFAMAVKLFEMKRVSSGQAAQDLARASPALAHKRISCAVAEKSATRKKSGFELTNVSI
jgi:hypothetical protein